MANNDKPAWIKSGFEQTVENLYDIGPSARVTVSARERGATRYAVIAQIDTGAGGTGISPRLAEKLGIAPVDSGLIHEAGREPIAALYYPVSLALGPMVVELEVAGLPSLGDPHDVLVGRDVLGKFRLIVDFTTGQTQLHFKNE